MSDDDSAPPPPRLAIDNAAVTAFMERRTDRYACPICGNVEWLAMNDEDGQVSAVPKATQDGVIDTFGEPMLTMCCDRCGFTRQHHLGLFKQYLESQQNGG